MARLMSVSHLKPVHELLQWQKKRNDFRLHVRNYLWKEERLDAIIGKPVLHLICDGFKLTSNLHSASPHPSNTSDYSRVNEEAVSSSYTHNLLECR